MAFGFGPYTIWGCLDGLLQLFCHRALSEVFYFLNSAQPGSQKLYIDRSRRLRAIYSLWLPGWSL
ncbi:hypothetical protein DPMN_076190 [Dreissena polymorpha]|uniref:Uncharacterized protein n=1 Tax=Dreissena polymorpha TaxID=45954 RepID=A0A9D4BQ99_DREPO|nr:hypothetical protein DPMN_076190 [Dreissena polymorpha]